MGQQSYNTLQHGVMMHAMWDSSHVTSQAHMPSWWPSHARGHAEIHVAASATLEGREADRQAGMPLRPSCAVSTAAQQVTTGRPACLARMDGHMVLVNSAALQLAGITADTPDPEGGIIDRDEAGQPTGILRCAAEISI
jgi:predicted amidohydrolase YtcJ